MKKFLASFIIIFFLTVFSFPSFINAQEFDRLGDDTDFLNNRPSTPSGSPTRYSTGNPNTFGGRLNGTFYCNCSNSLMLFIQDYKTGSLKRFIYGPGSNLLVGSPYGLYQIGSYSSGGICLIYTGTNCSSIQNDGLIGGGSPGFGTSS